MVCFVYTLYRENPTPESFLVDKRKNTFMVFPDNSDDCLKIHKISSSDSFSA